MTLRHTLDWYMTLMTLMTALVLLYCRSVSVEDKVLRCVLKMANVKTPHNQKYNIYKGDSNVFHVESILQCRTKKSKKEYLIQWKGYSSQDNSCIPGIDVTPDLKKLFHQKEALAKKERKKNRVLSVPNSSKKIKTEEVLHEEVEHEEVFQEQVLDVERMAVLPMPLIKEKKMKQVLSEIPVSVFYPQGQQKRQILSSKKQCEEEPEAQNKLGRQKRQLKAKKQSASKAYNRISTQAPIPKLGRQKRQLKAKKQSSAATKPSIQTHSVYSQDKDNEVVSIPLPEESTLTSECGTLVWQESQVSDDEDKDLLGFDEDTSPLFL